MFEFTLGLFDAVKESTNLLLTQTDAHVIVTVTDLQMKFESGPVIKSA